MGSISHVIGERSPAFLAGMDRESRHFNGSSGEQPTLSVRRFESTGSTLPSPVARHSSRAFHKRAACREIVEFIAASPTSCRPRRERSSLNRIRGSMACSSGESESCPGGELRYLELMLILSLGRPIVLLDEPFSRMEPIYVQAMKEELRNDRESRCVLLTDHCYQDVMEVCSPVSLLRSGRIHAVSAAGDLAGYLPAATNGLTAR